MGEWIIIQPQIVEGINKACKEYLNAKKEPSNPSVPNLQKALIGYIKDNKILFPPSIISEYESVNEPITEDLLKCALNKKSAPGSLKNGNGVNIKVAGKTPLLVDLLCYFAYGKNWLDTLKDLELTANIETRGQVLQQADKKQQTINATPIIQHVKNVITNNQITERIENTVIKTQIEDFSKSQIQVIDQNFWKAYELPDNKKAVLRRYYTHADSSLVKEVIANNDAVSPNDFVLVADSDGNIEQRTITEIIKSPDRYGIFLLKIILEGGVGKTTFLHWIAKHYQDSYNFILVSYVGSLDIRKIITKTKSLKKQNGLPVSLLLDNVSDGSVSKQFERLIREIKAEPELSDTLFIIAERESRYQNEFIDSKAEMLFGGNVLSIVNVEVNREILFDKIYDYLLIDNSTLADQTIRKQAKDEFLNNDIQSISESIHYLIKSLKLKNVIQYIFDWEDWAANKFEKQKLQFLYAVVACFYQFGIKVSTSISTKILGFALEIDIVNAINRFGGNKCPIQITEDARFLSLKHEHLANWFLDYPENRKLVLTFFRAFLTEIDNKTNAKLLRKIRKVFKRDEFRNSILAEEFNLPVYIEIIKAYIELPTTNTDEKIKMLMEEGIAYNLLGNEKEAIHSFDGVLKIDENNNHAKDQLARIYLNSSATYSLAFSKYLEIYKNKGYYALKHMYFIIQKCKEEGVKLSLENIYAFSNSEIIDILRLFIDERNLEEAIELLKIFPEENYDYEVAKLHNRIAHSLPFSDDTIEKKRLLFIKAISINDRLGALNENFQFDVDYVVFLYRIREFSKSTAAKKKVLGKFPKDMTSEIEEAFIHKIRSITKLFFINIPDKSNLKGLSDYLYEQCWNAAAFINRNIKDPEIIIKGILLLHTVRFHSRNLLPKIFRSTTLQLGYAYTYHTEKQINNFSTLDRREMAENYYDSALKIGAEFSYGDCLDMIRNLQNYKTREKSEKSIRLISLFFQNSINKKCPGFHRMRGNANTFLGKYPEAIEDYKEAEKLIPAFKFREKEHRINDQVFLFNNLASAICDMYEKKQTYKQYDLETAYDYVSKSLTLKPDFGFAKETFERVKKLME